MSNNKHGNLSIDSDNLFPIIKKWLYSDHDIFYRELISNGCDAITKLKKLDMMGEYSLPADYKPQIQVLLNPEEKTLKFIDNGLGMTADEVEEYINKVAFSGATDFIEKYKDKSSDDQIIGHFGLGFYSAFMVADEVTIDTLSFTEGATPVHWSCDGGTEFDMTDGTKDTVGTEITLYMNEDCLEFVNEYKAREVISKYCSFMPTEIYVKNVTAADEYEIIKKEDKLDTDTVIEEIHEDAKTEEKTNDKGEKEIVEVSPATDKLKIKKRPVPINDIHPLWAKTPKDCTDEEYIDFYRKVFNDYKEPLFWIHLNMDYPFNLKGILYFPKINTEYESIEGTIKLYNNQVFIADNIKEVIPEFLMLLKGVIDCPDLPLNVSRSALQNDGFVKKISDYITKKVADKLSGLCKTDKENYEKYWDDISPFIKYGCLKDTKFCDKMNDYILFKDIYEKYQTLPELLKPVEKADDEKTENNAESENADNANSNNAQQEDKRTTIYYVTDLNQQGQYINLFKEQEMNAVILNSTIDTSFITQLEQRNSDYKFMRIDADLTDTLKNDDADLADETTALSELFKKVLNKDKLTIKVESLKNDELASILTLSEQGRRMQDMFKIYAANGMGGMDPNMFAADETLTLNANNELVKYLFENKDADDISMYVEQIYDLARITNAPLSVDDMSKFIKRSNDIMLKNMHK
ncbi:molecular chaperone HtpG [Lachnobacterium bovis]|uniref:Molecular chaperone HtpG n=1 Tax=Lachnobacterium bovis DSM 14045 TaxID=1122142 RepID=A0A1H3LL83_9FIRM|nr:molecular chaperone HtpG [Lachnobacterium bovis]SDY65182.1 molecular chaperone HtpG [Lachnobacterium bovis DSM 14045]